SSMRWSGNASTWCCNHAARIAATVWASRGSARSTPVTRAPHACPDGTTSIAVTARGYNYGSLGTGGVSMGARSITAVGMAVATLGSLAAPTQVAAEGIRVGPLETVCVAVPDDLDAAVGDVVIASVTVADPSAPGHVVA